MKIVSACGSGLGSSLMVSMKISDILKKLNVEAEVSHSDLSSLIFSDADVYVLSKDIAESIEAQRLDQNKIISLSNILDDAEITAKLKEKLGI